MAYFPNGTAGAAFDEECSDCPLGEQPCPIALVQTAQNYAACNNAVASEILGALVADSGACSMKPLVRKLATTLLPDEAQAWREEQIAALVAGKDRNDARRR